MLHENDVCAIYLVLSSCLPILPIPVYSSWCAGKVLSPETICHPLIQYKSRNGLNPFLFEDWGSNLDTPSCQGFFYHQ